MPDRKAASGVPVGRIVGVFGIRGALKVEPLTDFLERFEPKRRVWIAGQPYTILSVHVHNGQVRISVEGVDSPEAAEALRGSLVTVPEEERPQLEEGEYRVGDLIGMDVVTDTGYDVGTLDAVLPYPAQDILKIGDVLIPMSAQFVKEIDLERRTITVTPLPGMIEGLIEEPEDSEEPNP